ncbi:YqaJ viral recombinase family protein [Gordonia rubripertincta]|uniref:YqaJ viral recombinase family protein n=1 Tax=Gordonia rubripertincta TaxID=36822 RepID=A0AAW4G9T1_GORRU|nr:lambda exonuclease family protein [Gordonia rubripertincta]MBM7280327.1 YqaJ viral recombinase family protein [Gordonia rubripertincta]
MTLTIHEKIEQRSPEWFEQRRGIVTASVVGQLITTRKLSAIDYPCPECEAPAQNPCRGKKGQEITTKHTARADEARRNSSAPILEVASNDDSRRLTTLLVSERVTGWSYPPGFISDDMLRGIEHEPIARDKYAAEKGATVTEVGIMIEDKWGFKIGFSPDGLVESEGLLEIKCPRPAAHMKTIIADAVPPEHMPQLQAGLLVSGRKWIDFVSFCAGMPLFHKRIYPDPTWQRVIVEAVRRFEDNARELARIYHENAAGLTPTERILEPEEIIV